MHTELIKLLREAKTLEANRLELDRQSKRLKTDEDNAKALLMAEMQKLGLPLISVEGVGSATIAAKERPFIVDYTLLEQYIVENKATDLLQKRLTESAVKARWEDGIRIPGVGLITEQKLTLR